MKFSEDLAVNAFLRSYQYPFTLKDFTRFMSRQGFELTPKKGDMYLAESPYVFEVASGQFLTRAGIFTDRFFSFTLTAEEIQNKMFVPGHRFMPFVDEMQNPALFVFIWNEKFLGQRTGEFRKETALDLYRLYGEEYEVQYIASDPALAKLDLAASDFELPPRVTLTGCDLSYFIDAMGLCAGDRILCRVLNWDRGIIEVCPQHRERPKAGDPILVFSTDRERALWCEKFEKTLLKIISTEGPCSTIEEQLALTFFDNIDELCTENCDSVENFLARSKKIGLELFGVETRLWYKNQSVPAVGSWNDGDRERDPVDLDNLTFTVPDYVLDCYLKDFEFNKRSDVSSLMKTIFPPKFELSPSDRDDCKRHIEERHKAIKREYNYFADFAVGAIRRKALDLYSKVSALVSDVEMSKAPFQNFPQQELVILSQLFTHINRILESINTNPDAAVEEMSTLSLSIEGMEYNFEDIEEAILDVIEAQRRSGFTVV